MIDLNAALNSLLKLTSMGTTGWILAGVGLVVVLVIYFLTIKSNENQRYQDDLAKGGAATGEQAQDGAKKNQDSRDSADEFFGRDKK